MQLWPTRWLRLPLRALANWSNASPSNASPRKPSMNSRPARNMKGTAQFRSASCTKRAPISTAAGTCS
eukprot:6968120-Pyramimonas_sp.AAC.1